MRPENRICMLASMLVPLIGFLGSSGCISPTLEMKRQMAFVHDAAEIVVKSGVKPNDRLSRELAASAKLLEAIIKPPPTEHRLPISSEPERRTKDLDAVATSRKRAAEDAKAGGFWTIVTRDSLFALGTIATILGLGGVGTWLKERAEQVEKIKREVDEFEDDVTKHEGTIRSAATRISEIGGEDST